MDCQKTMENFPDYRNDRLEPEVRADMEAHLRECIACHSQFEAFSVVDAELNRWREIEPSPWLEQKVMARLDTDQGVRRRPPLMAWPRPQWAAMIVLFIVAGLGSWVMLHRPGRAVEPSRSGEIKPTP